MSILNLMFYVSEDAIDSKMVIPKLRESYSKHVFSDKVFNKIEKKLKNQKNQQKNRIDQPAQRPDLILSNGETTTKNNLNTFVIIPNNY